MFKSTLFLVLLAFTLTKCEENCNFDSKNMSIEEFKKVMPSLEQSYEGENAKVLILEGTDEVATRSYFVAMAALKAGADQVRLLAPESVSRMVQSFSPDFNVYPYFGRKELPIIEYLVSLTDVVVLGSAPTSEDGFLVRDVIQICKDMKKPLVVIPGAVDDVAMNVTMLNDYPAPGAILVPSRMEMEELVKTMGKKDFSVWGDHVSVLFSGKVVDFYDPSGPMWSLEEVAPTRRTEAGADILGGFLGTFYNFALKSPCGESPNFVRNVASYAAARLMKEAEKEAFASYGRPMTSSDVLNVVHKAYKNLFD